MNQVQFGVFLAPAADDPQGVAARARAAERAGFDYVSIQDHPYVPAYLDTFTLIAHLAAQTERLRFMPNVANLPLRPAPMLAKASATIDLLSGGRFELGLGGGRVWDEIAGLGGPRWTPRETVEAMTEAIDVLRLLWEPGRLAEQAGDHYPVRAQSGPAPAHRIGIWLGAFRPRMLDLLGRKADGWVAPLGTRYETKAEAQERIDAAAHAAGREPTDVRRAIQLVGSVTETPLTKARPTSGPGNQPIRTTPELWAQIVCELVGDERFDTINFIPERESAEQVEHFGEAVIPLVRESLVTRTRP
jgi:alkanesulfonate monooxygenase SsuD/methylene tetrahydromethanopterin reductase-like flavin-dependent oxidoreductase (luciferase family)